MTTIDYNLRCSQCTGDLRGAELHGACPHCWADVSDTVAVALIDPVTHTVADDVSCIECGCNVRTLRLAANCPECGLAVLESVRPDELRFADVKWLKRVRGGVTNLLLSAGAWLILLLLIAAEKAPGAFVMTLMGIGVWTVGGITGFVGLVWSTTKDPDPQTPRAARVAGKVVRGCCLLIALCVTGSIFIDFGFASWVTVVGIRSLLLSATFTGMVCLCLCLRHVAMRGRDRRLRKLSTVLRYVIAAGGVLSVLGSVWMIKLQPIIRMARAPVALLDVWLAMLDFCYSAIFGPLSICILIPGAVALLMYHELLSKAIEQAEFSNEPHPSGHADSSERGNPD